MNCILLYSESFPHPGGFVQCAFLGSFWPLIMHSGICLYNAQHWTNLAVLDSTAYSTWTGAFFHFNFCFNFLPRCSCFAKKKNFFKNARPLANIAGLNQPLKKQTLIWILRQNSFLPPSSVDFSQRTSPEKTSGSCAANMKRAFWKKKKLGKVTRIVCHSVWNSSRSRRAPTRTRVTTSPHSHAFLRGS